MTSSLLPPRSFSASQVLFEWSSDREGRGLPAGRHRQSGRGNLHVRRRQQSQQARQGEHRSERSL
jgi:hypothetical protein